MAFSPKELVLLLLSSALMSNQSSSPRSVSMRKRKNVQQQDAVEALATIPSDGERSSAGAPSPLGSPRSIEAPPFENGWSFWYDLQPKQRKLVAAEVYLNHLHKTGTFYTVNELVSQWKDVLKVAPAHEECNYRLFREGIQPIWEDPQNINGGKWVVVTKPNKRNHDATSDPQLREEAFKSWLSLVVTLLMGEFALAEEICGAVLSIRSWGYMITLWNKNSEDKAQIDSVMKKLKALFPRKSIKYQPHEASITKTVKHSPKGKNGQKPKKNSSKQQKEKKAPVSPSASFDKVIKPPQSRAQESNEVNELEHPHEISHDVANFILREDFSDISPVISTAETSDHEEELIKEMEQVAHEVAAIAIKDEEKDLFIPAFSAIHPQLLVDEKKEEEASTSSEAQGSESEHEVEVKEDVQGDSGSDEKTESSEKEVEEEAPVEYGPNNMDLEVENNTAAAPDTETKNKKNKKNKKKKSKKTKQVVEQSAPSVASSIVSSVLQHKKAALSVLLVGATSAVSLLTALYFQ